YSFDIYYIYRFFGLIYLFHISLNKNGYDIFTAKIPSDSIMKNVTVYITTFGESDQSEFRQFDLVADNRNIAVRVFRFIRLYIVIFRFETWGFILFLKES